MNFMKISSVSCGIHKKQTIDSAKIAQPIGNHITGVNSLVILCNHGQAVGGIGGAIGVGDDVIGGVWIDIGGDGGVTADEITVV